MKAFLMACIGATLALNAPHVHAESANAQSKSKATTKVQEEHGNQGCHHTLAFGPAAGTTLHTKNPGEQNHVLKQGHEQAGVPTARGQVAHNGDLTVGEIIERDCKDAVAY